MLKKIGNTLRLDRQFICSGLPLHYVLGFLVKKYWVLIVARNCRSLNLFGSTLHFTAPSEIGFMEQLIVESLFLKHHIPHHGLLIDIGGNIGQFFFFLRHVLNLKQQILSYEPIKTTYDILKKNNPDARHAAISPHKEITLSYGHSSLVASEYPEEGSYITETIPGTLLQHDQAVVDAKSIALLKIDTEGSELGILQSISDEMYDKTHYALIECSGPGRPNSGGLEEVVSFLASKGFEVVSLGSCVYQHHTLSIIDVLFKKSHK